MHMNTKKLTVIGGTMLAFAVLVVGLARWSNLLSINGIFLVLLYVSLFITPLCVGAIWVKRLLVARKTDNVRYCWREILLLAAQLMLTAAVALVWYWLLNHSSGAGPEEDRYLSKFFRTSAVLAIAALVGSLLGTGTAKRVTAVSSVLVLINWLAVGAFL
jgi:hypothetical protein